MFSSCACLILDDCGFYLAVYICFLNTLWSPNLSSISTESQSKLVMLVRLVMQQKGIRYVYISDICISLLWGHSYPVLPSVDIWQFWHSALAAAPHGFFHLYRSYCSHSYFIYFVVIVTSFERKTTKTTEVPWLLLFVYQRQVIHTNPKSGEGKGLRFFEPAEDGAPRSRCCFCRRVVRFLSFVVIWKWWRREM